MSTCVVNIHWVSVYICIVLLCAGDPAVAESGDAGSDVQTEREGHGVGERHYSRVSWRGSREEEGGKD